MSRLSVQLQYDRKIAELTGKIQKVAKELQNIEESKNSALLEVNELRERKATLGKILDDLELKIKERNQTFQDLMDRENRFNDSIKQEQAKEKLHLLEAQNILEKTENFLDEKNHVKTELENFLKKESYAREKYLVISGQLSESERKYLEFEKKYIDENENLLKTNERLDAYKQYLSDLYGKLATYVSMARKTIEHINEELKDKKIPFWFNFPEGEIFEIKFDNFNIKKTDT